jgi:predicted Zn-dependent protease
VGLDADYVKVMAVRRWTGGPFHHCIAPEVDRATVDPIIAEMTALTGIPRTEEGTCNVEWFADYIHPAGHTYTKINGTEDVIVSVQIFLYHRGAGSARHEMGHAIGLAPNHSPRPGDLMYATPRVDTFTADELAVLAWMYQR